MRPTILALSLFAVGCSTYHYEESSSVIGIEDLPKSCWRYDRKVPINLVVRNLGQTTAKFLISKETSRSPYIASWLSYDVLLSSGEPAIEHGPGGHGSLPQNTLEITPGDSANLIAYFYAPEVLDRTKRFKISLESEDGKLYYSPEFTPCSK
jgi:hypothetical protein